MNEFAVIKTGGKQYKVSNGDVVKIEKLSAQGGPASGWKVGDKIVFDEVLLIVDSKDTIVGMPHVTGSKVEATLDEIGRNKTVEVIKYKQKSRYFKKNGHRQPWFKVRISGIK